MEYYIKKGWRLNPNEKVVAGITKGLARNNGYCPCHNKYAGTEDAKCPCKAYIEENHCCCSLYLPIENTIMETLKKIAIFFGLFLFLVGAGCSIGWMIYLKEWVALAGSLVTIGFAIPTVIALVKKLIA